MVTLADELVETTLPLVEGEVAVACEAAWAELNWLAALDNTEDTPLQAESNMTEMISTLVRLTKFLFMVSSKKISRLSL